METSNNRGEQQSEVGNKYDYISAIANKCRVRIKSLLKSAKIITTADLTSIISTVDAANDLCTWAKQFFWNEINDNSKLPEDLQLDFGDEAGELEQLQKHFIVPLLAEEKRKEAEKTSAA